MRLPRHWSMSESSEFLNVRSQGVSRAGRFLVVSTMENDDLKHLKCAFITTKKVGNAVVRNLLRRRFRAILQRHGEEILRTRYIVTIARWNAKTATFEELERDWIKTARKLGVLPEDYGKAP